MQSFARFSDTLPRDQNGEDDSQHSCPMWDIPCPMWGRNACVRRSSLRDLIAWLLTRRRFKQFHPVTARGR